MHCLHTFKTTLFAGLQTGLIIVIDLELQIQIRKITSDAVDILSLTHHPDLGLLQVADDGRLTQWSSSYESSQAQQCHADAIQCIHLTDSESKSQHQQILTGGSDGQIHVCPIPMLSAVY